jgi:hypothetical protein
MAGAGAARWTVIEDAVPSPIAIAAAAAALLGACDEIGVRENNRTTNTDYP